MSTDTLPNHGPVVEEAAKENKHSSNGQSKSPTYLEPIIYDEKDLELVTIPVTIGKHELMLREASGDATIKWRNAQMRCAKMTNDGKLASVDGLADTESLLISFCLVDKQGRQVSKDFVRGLKPRIQKRLFETIKKISDLEETEMTDEQLEEEIRKLEGKREERRGKNAESMNSITDGSD